ncbi:MAG: hypothetical protein O7G85_10145 [Planctomycetota bacterium]|nr:hypothetical protein [Planctomycetota bacterium]
MKVRAWSERPTLHHKRTSDTEAKHYDMMMPGLNVVFCHHDPVMFERTIDVQPLSFVTEAYRHRIRKTTIKQEARRRAGLPDA